jgi:hypothetical protein
MCSRKCWCVIDGTKAAPRTNWGCRALVWRTRSSVTDLSEAIEARCLTIRFRRTAVRRRKFSGSRNRVCLVWKRHNFQETCNERIVRQVGSARPSGNRGAATATGSGSGCCSRWPAGLQQPARLERFHTGRTQKPLKHFCVCRIFELKRDSTPIKPSACFPRKCFS